MPFDQALRIFGRHPQAINGSRVRARTLRPEILIAINRLSPNRMAVLIHFSPEQHGLLDVKKCTLVAVDWYVRYLGPGFSPLDDSRVCTLGPFSPRPESELLAGCGWKHVWS